MTAPSFDEMQAHRWFAVEWNNLAWDLLEAPSRSEEETERMIHAAHGACLHWMQAGDGLHHLRAETLLTQAYAVAGLGEAALRHAARTLELLAAAGQCPTPFDRATAHACAARAYALAGQSQQAFEQQALAQVAADNLEDPAEQQVFERLRGVIS